MRGIVTKVARENGVAIVDYIGLLEERMQREFGQPVPGKEYFLDHVHPTIEGHKILALALIRSMTEQDLVRPGVDWGQEVITQVATKIEGGVDQAAHGQALANLARVLFWAGKEEDAARLANQAMENAGDDMQVATNATGTLVTYSLRQGDLERARQQLTSALEDVPKASELHLKLGKLLGKRPYLELDQAAAHLLWACQQLPNNDIAYQLFGQIMAWRERPMIAYASLQEALRLNPNNEDARKILAQIEPLLGEQSSSSETHETSVERYPNEGPRKLVQFGEDGRGRIVADGITVEFHENGRVKRLVDFDRGVKSGVETTWDDSGQVLSRVVAEQGNLVDLEFARRQLYRALVKDPLSIKPRLQLGIILMNPPILQIDEAAAHLLLACQQQPNSDVAFQLFGQAMARRGRLDFAYTSLKNALHLNPGNQIAKKTLAEIAPLLKDQPKSSDALQFRLERFPSGAPRKLVQQRQLADGRSVSDGISVEYHENGRIKRLVDSAQGVQDGLEMTWNENGRLLSCVIFFKGKPRYGNFES
jgi:antitoxin component YwqK of YwqJK toxin-antitoxin module